MSSSMPAQIVDVLTFLRDEHEFSLLSALTAVDYWPQEKPRFHVIYQLTSLTQNLSVQLRVPVDGERAQSPDRDRRVRERQLARARAHATCSASSSRAIPIRGAS